MGSVYSWPHALWTQPRALQLGGVYTAGREAQDRAAGSQWGSVIRPCPSAAPVASRLGLCRPDEDDGLELGGWHHRHLTGFSRLWSPPAPREMGQSVVAQEAEAGGRRLKSSRVSTLKAEFLPLLSLSFSENSIVAKPGVHLQGGQAGQSQIMYHWHRRGHDDLGFQGNPEAIMGVNILIGATGRDLSQENPYLPTWKSMRSSPPMEYTEPSYAKAP
ncbi:uncharacterized protein LOC129681257 [Psammomys obesus]|uniref:uncharacterized protein LOC129681257 n=1 Tax=Psammomys obesus TaxID=48139 RepID=UPI002453409B|nr:uncharacterized protein LOC129681257 [Psammomys obesus]